MTAKVDPGQNEVDKTAPFWAALEDENAPTIIVDGVKMKHAVWNLLIHLRDMRMYCGPISMKPHRNWKISTVKKYYGLKGGKHKIHDSLRHIYKELREKNKK
jgi:hypothetical protein